MRECFLKRPVLCKQFLSGLGPDTRQSRNIIDAIAHHPEVVDDLFYSVQSKFLTNLSLAPNLWRITPATRAIHENVWAYELPEVLVGSHHVGCKTFLFGFFRQGSYDVVRLKTGHANGGNIEGFKNFVNVGHRNFDRLWRSITVCLVLREHFVTLRGLR